MTRPREEVRVGDVVRLKKPHPCGSYEWEVTRLGMDAWLTCRGCGRKVRLMRSEFERRMKCVVGRTEDL